MTWSELFLIVIKILALFISIWYGSLIAAKTMGQRNIGWDEFVIFAANLTTFLVLQFHMYYL